MRYLLSRAILYLPFLVIRLGVYDRALFFECPIDSVNISDSYDQYHVSVLGACLIVLSVVVSGAGCTLGPNYTRPEVNTPDAFIYSEKEAAETANMEWWKLFDGHGPGRSRRGGLGQQQEHPDGRGQRGAERRRL